MATNCSKCNKILSRRTQYNKKATGLCLKCFHESDTWKKVKVGVKPWNTGIQLPESQRLKQSETMKKRWAEKNNDWWGGPHPLKGKPAHNKGSKTPLESRIKQSLAKTGLDKFEGFLWENRGVIRKLYEYSVWRKGVLNRDSLKCVLCNKPNYRLEVDHYPVAFSDIMRMFDIKTVEDAKNCSKLWDIKNGRTLCHKCHVEHTYNKKLN